MYQTAVLVNHVHKKNSSKVYPISADDKDFQSTTSKPKVAFAVTASSSGSRNRRSDDRRFQSKQRLKKHGFRNNNDDDEDSDDDDNDGDRGYDKDSDCSSSIHSDDRIIQEMKKQKGKNEDGKETMKVVPYDDGEDNGIEESRRLEVGDNWSKKPLTVSGKKPLSMKAKNQLLRDQIVQEVLDNVLPTLGAFDESKNKAFRPPDPFYIRWLRFIGCLPLTLHDAVLSGSLEEVERTLKKLCKGPQATPELVNEYNSEGMTPLSVATKLNDVDICAELVDHHAVIECPDEGTGRTPLFHAVQNRNHDLVFLYLKYGANPNSGDMQCMTPLMLAASTDDYKTVRMLCNNGHADVDLQDERGWTAVHYAVYANAVKALAILLHEGADREIKDMNGETPLKFAIFRDYDACISLLCKKHVPLA